MVATASRPVTRVFVAPVSSVVANAPFCAVTETKFFEPNHVLLNSIPLAALALLISWAETPVESAMRFTANAIAHAVVRLGNARNALDGGVNLELVRRDFIRRQRAAVGSLHHQVLHIEQQRRDFRQRAFGSRDHITCALRVIDGLVDARDLTAQTFGGDKPRR